MASIISASTTSSTALNLSGDTTGILQIATGATPTTAVTIDASQKVTFAQPIQGGSITSGTAVASTSGTAVLFTGIPSWAKRITVMFNGVSLSGTSNILIQIGSGSVTTTSYQSSAGIFGASTSGVTSTTGFIVYDGATASQSWYGITTLCLLSSNTWIGSSAGGLNIAFGSAGGGVSPNLAGALDRINITTVNGTDTFDAGSINIMYEG